MEPEKLEIPIVAEAEVIEIETVPINNDTIDTIARVARETGEAIEAMTAIDPNMIEHIEPIAKKRVRKEVAAV